MFINQFGGAGQKVKDGANRTKEYLKSYKNPILDFQPKDSFSESYTEFYNNLFD